MPKENAQMFPPAALLERLLVPEKGAMSTTIHIRELGACGHEECREYPAMDAACYAARRVYARTYPALCDVRVGDDVRELQRAPAPRVFAAQFVEQFTGLAWFLAIERRLPASERADTGEIDPMFMVVAYGNKMVALCRRCAKRFAAAYAKRANVSGAG
jgi:hypothetical protein